MEWKRSTCWSVLMCCEKNFLSWVTFWKKKKYVCIPRSFLVTNVCNQGKTLCSPCRTILDVAVKRKNLAAVKDWHDKVTSYMYYTPTKWNTYFCLNDLGFRVLKMQLQFALPVIRWTFQLWKFIFPRICLWFCIIQSKSHVPIQREASRFALGSGDVKGFALSREINHVF